MLHLNLAHDFETGVVRKWRQLIPAAEGVRLRLFKGASTAVIGAVGGWGAVVVLGAVLMSGARHETIPTAAPESAPAVASVTAPAAPAVAPAPAPVAALAKPVQPIPSPAPTKVTQRVDMSPTAAIPEAPKAHKKPKKKKPLDNAN